MRFYQAIEPVAPAGLIDLRSGDLLGSVVSDIDTLQEVYLRGVAPLLVALVTAALVTLFFVCFDPLVALIMLGFVILGGVGLPSLIWWAGHGPGRRLIAVRSQLYAALTDIFRAWLMVSFIDRQKHR